jgi:hypothetical protein
MVSGPPDPFDLDSLAVSDRFRLFNFTRRDDYIAYLWVLRATDRLRGRHVAQSHTDDVANVLAELAATHDGVPASVGNLRERLDKLAEDADSRLRTARAQLRAAEARASAEHDKLIGAQRDLAHGRDALAGAVTELAAQAAAFGPYALGDLRPLLGVTEAAPWPGPAQWPAGGARRGRTSGSARRCANAARTTGRYRRDAARGGPPLSWMPTPARPAVGGSSPKGCSRVRWTGCGAAG